MESSNNTPQYFRDVMPQIQAAFAEGKRVCFGPKGTSMLPMIRQGVDTVELAPAPEKLKKFDLPLYLRENGQYVLHRVVRVDDAYTCVGDNQFDLEYPVTHDQILALVTAFTRGSRRISVTAPGYRAYCAFWHYSRPIRHLYRRAVYCIRAAAKRLFGRK